MPAGLYKPEEENPREIVEATIPDSDDPVPKPLVRDMVNESAWVHHPLCLLKQGRLTHKLPEAVDDKEPE